MVIEWLKVKVSPELREKFIQKDSEIWTSKLASYPGFLSKEVWIVPGTSTELVLVIRWASREQWQAIPSEELVQTEQKFNQEFGCEYQFIEESEYQIRKFPLMSS